MFETWSEYYIFSPFLCVRNPTNDTSTTNGVESFHAYDNPPLYLSYHHLLYQDIDVIKQIQI